MMITRAAALVVLSALLYGCTFNTGRDVDAKFEPKEAMYIFTVGRASLRGQVFVRTPDGKIHVAKNSVVTLVPATAYAQERVAAIYGERKSASETVQFSDPDPRYKYFTRKTRTNAQGNFAFIDISDGDYFVTTVVKWGNQTRSLIKRVNISKNAKVKVILSERVS